jgi:hypothetical protein
MIAYCKGEGELFVELLAGFRGSWLLLLHFDLFGTCHQNF